MLTAPPLDSALSLVRQAQAGDAAALARLMREQRPSIARICASMCRSDPEADDVLQETLLAVVQNLASFRGDASFLTWVFTVARTQRARMLRRRRAHESRRSAWADRLAVQAAAATDARGVLGEGSSRGALESALGQLSAVDRRLTLLGLGAGFTAQELATREGLSVSAVKTRLHRARVALRRELGETLAVGYDARASSGVPVAGRAPRSAARLRSRACRPRAPQ